jgi:hypothetical protein
LVARKLEHLFDVLRPTLVGKIWMTQPKTWEEFLTAARLLSDAAEVAGQGSWAVNLLAEEKEKQLRALAAVMEKQGEAESTPTLQQLVFKLAARVAVLENRLQEQEEDDEM